MIHATGEGELSQRMEIPSTLMAPIFMSEDVLVQRVARRQDQESPKKVHPKLG